MNVMILVPSFGRSSPIYSAFLFAKYLHEHNVNVVFASLDNNYNSKKNIISEIKRAGIDFKCFDIKGWRGIFSHRSRVQDLCNAQSITIVLAYLLRPTLIASSLKNVIKMASVRGILKNNYALKLGKTISKIPVFMEMRALKKMDLVFSMTETMTEWLMSEGISSDKISIVNNFIDVKSVISSAKSESPYERRQDNKNINIGTFCFLYRIKRIDVALKAVNKLVCHYGQTNALFHLAGDGPQRRYLEKMTINLNIKKQVVFHGHLENPLPLMKNMDLVVLTSDSEGVPKCLIEALSLGKTVIASDIPGVNELIMDNKTGYLFPVRDSEKLASLIDGIINDNKYLQTEQLVNYVLKNYDIDSCCKKMFGVMREKHKELYN